MFLWIGAAILVISAVLGTWLGRWGWPFELFTSLLPQIGALSVLYALSLTLLGRPGIALCVLAVAGLCAYGAREALQPAGAPLAQHDVRVVWANLHDGRDSLARTVRLARQENADIIVCAEFPNRLDDAQVAAIAGEYRRYTTPANGARYKVEILSRIPVADGAPIQLDWRPNRQGLSVSVETSAGPLRLVAIHPSVPAIPLAQHARDETIALAFTRLRESATPSILVGDFNTVTWSALIRQATRDGAVTRAHTGAGSTWMSPLPVLGLPIDHAFAANGARISARVGPGIGSDHLPLIIEVQLER